MLIDAYYSRKNASIIWQGLVMVVVAVVLCEIDVFIFDTANSELDEENQFSEELIEETDKGTGDCLDEVR